MERLSFFDCNCTIGTRQVKNPGSYYRLDDQLRKMDHYGIGRALACHAIACGYNQAEGNRMLMESISGRGLWQGRLLGKWVVAPHHAGDFPAPDALRRQMKSAGVRSVMIMPRKHIYSIAEWVCGELFAMLEECKAPVFVSVDEIGYGELHAVLSRHPGLRVVLTHLRYDSTRNLYPLLEKFQHLYVETIGFKVYGGIEDVCARFGAERLIFGTCAPLYAGSGAVGMVMYADIGEAEKRKIASGNLDKLLGEVAL
ncbi:MAG: amidohydrolase [Oscillospiraceae bacterium]|nr:amidohydrolase [Oscillospiraceae bacterium]